MMWNSSRHCWYLMRLNLDCRKLGAFETVDCEETTQNIRSLVEKSVLVSTEIVAKADARQAAGTSAGTGTRAKAKRGQPKQAARQVVAQPVSQPVPAPTQPLPLEEDEDDSDDDDDNDNDEDEETEDTENQRMLKELEDDEFAEPAGVAVDGDESPSDPDGLPLETTPSAMLPRYMNEAFKAAVGDAAANCVKYELSRVQSRVRKSADPKSKQSNKGGDDDSGGNNNKNNNNSSSSSSSSSNSNHKEESDGPALDAVRLLLNDCILNPTRTIYLVSLLHHGYNKVKGELPGPERSPLLAALHHLFTIIALAIDPFHQHTSFGKLRRTSLSMTQIDAWCFVFRWHRSSLEQAPRSVKIVLLRLQTECCPHYHIFALRISSSPRWATRRAASGLLHLSKLQWGEQMRVIMKGMHDLIVLHVNEKVMSEIDNSVISTGHSSSRCEKTFQTIRDVSMRYADAGTEKEGIRKIMQISTTDRDHAGLLKGSTGIKDTVSSPFLFGEIAGTTFCTEHWPVYKEIISWLIVLLLALSRRFLPNGSKWREVTATGNFLVKLFRFYDTAPVSEEAGSALAGFGTLDTGNDIVPHNYGLLDRVRRAIFYFFSWRDIDWFYELRYVQYEVLKTQEERKAELDVCDDRLQYFLKKQRAVELKLIWRLLSNPQHRRRPAVIGKDLLVQMIPAELRRHRLQAQTAPMHAVGHGSRDGSQRDPTEAINRSNSDISEADSDLEHLVKLCATNNIPVRLQHVITAHQLEAHNSKSTTAIYKTAPPIEDIARRLESAKWESDLS
jgi:hypothetical protein